MGFKNVHTVETIYVHHITILAFFLFFIFSLPLLIVQFYITSLFFNLILLLLNLSLASSTLHCTFYFTSI